MAILNDSTGTLMSCAHKNRNCKIGIIIGKRKSHTKQNSKKKLFYINWRSKRLYFLFLTSADANVFFYDVHMTILWSRGEGETIILKKN